MKKKAFLLSLLSILTILGACAKENVSEKPASGTLEKTSETTSAYEKVSSAESTAASSDKSIAREEYTSTWSEEWKGLVTKIEKIVIVELPDEVVKSEKLSSNYITQVYFTLENNSDIDFYTFPDQSTLVIDGQQINSDFSSDNIGGEIMSGVTKSGMVTYQVEKPISVSEIKEIRLKWSAHYDTKNYEEEPLKDYDARLNLSK